MVEINLLPKEYQKQSDPSIWKYATWGVAGLTAAVLGGWFVSVSGDTSRLRQRSEALQQQIDAVAPQKQRFNELTARKNELEQVTNVALQLRDQKTYWSNDLAAFVDRLPANISLESVGMSTVTADGANPTYGGKAVTRQFELTGNARSQEAIISFLNAYETDTNFGVDFKSMQREEQSGLYNFNASVGVVGDLSTADNTPPAAVTPAAAPAGGTAPAAAPAAPAPAAPAAPAPAPAGGNP